MTVIMPCYIINERLLELTHAAVESLGKVYELIIIDDASPMGGGYLRSVSDIYIRNKTNLGYAASVNRGLRLATGELIAISNNDIRVSPNWQEVADEVFITDQIYSCHFRMTDYDVPFEYGDKIAYSGKERWCHASFFVINPKMLFFYDENYLNSFDDWDYFYSVRKSGLKTAYTDKACFQHVHTATVTLLPNHPETNHANREYFKEKWGGYPEDLFSKDYPDQMKIYYPDGFKI